MLGIAEQTDPLIVCNGYKDEEFMRLALLGQRVGHQVFIVLEQVSELLGPGKKTAERILLSLVQSGVLRLLVSTLLLHTNWRVRVAVARLLARSGAEELAPLLEHAYLKERSPRQRKITGWLLRKLEEGGASSERELAPVR